MADLALHGVGGIGGKGVTLKSKQSGTASLSGTNSTVTITTVDLSKAILLFSVKVTSGYYDATSSVRGILTNATTLTFVQGATGEFDVNWQVIELDGLKSIQRGTATLTTTSSTATISSVNTTKTVVIGTYAVSGYSGTDGIANIVLTNATTLTFTRKYAGGTNTINWQVIEFN